jgi:TorA maturation chaperone TorD
VAAQATVKPAHGAGLPPHAEAQARGRLYALLSRLILYGPDTALVALLSRLLELEQGAAEDGREDPDALAAAYENLFGFNLYPYQGVFLTADGLVGGAEADRVRQAYAAAGWSPLATVSPDHLGQELAFLAHLYTDLARQTSVAALPEAARAAPQRFLAEHLACWLPPFVLAVRRRGQALYTAVCDLLLELAVSDLPDGAVTMPAPGARLPDVPPLDPAQAGIREIATFLLCPPYSGLYLARDDLADLGRRHGVAAGVGERARILNGLFAAAGAQGAVTALVADLTSFAQSWRDAYAALGADLPQLTPWLAPWQTRAAATLALLARLAEQASDDSARQLPPF